MSRLATSPQASRSSSRWRDTSRLLEIALWVLVALLVVRLALFSLWAADRLSNGFAAHYTASRLLLEGAGVARFYDDAWFAARIADLAGPVYDLFRPNLPAGALLLLPVAWLDYGAARALWTVLSLACFVGTALFLARQLRLVGSWRPAFLALLLLFQPVYEQIGQGQNYLLMLALLTATWHGYRRGLPALTGISLGLMLVLKLLGGYLVLLLILERRWTSLARTALCMAAVVLASLPWIGPSAWLVYLREIPAFLRQPDLAVTAHQTQAGFLQHMLAYDHLYNPAPLLDATLLAPTLVELAFAVVLGASLFAMYRAPRSDPAFARLSSPSAIHPAHGSDLAFSIAVVANLILGPLSVDYQYTIVLLPIALLLGWLKKGWPVAQPHAHGANGDKLSRHHWVGKLGPLMPLLLFAVGTALIAADLPYRSPRLSSGAWALLAYPKLYGAWLLWGLALWGSLRKSVGRGSVPHDAEGV